MRVHWSSDGREDYLYWQKNDVQMVRKINELIGEIRRTPFTGTGRPEPLRGELSGWWSRRITSEHRIVYRVEGKGGDQHVTILMCRHHYKI
jgi:toxin YoeB